MGNTANDFFVAPCLIKFKLETSAKLDNVARTSGFRRLTNIRRRHFDSYLTIFNIKKIIVPLGLKKYIEKRPQLIAVTGTVKRPINRTVNRG